MKGAVSDSPAPPAGSPARPRALGLLDVFALGVNATVGSGVFALPDDLARAMGGASPLAFVLCTLLLLPVAHSFAELARRHDDQGAAFLYAHGAFGPLVGYLVGFFCWVNAFVSWAASATLLADVLGAPRAAQGLVGAGAALALGAVNWFGVKPGALVIRAVVVGKVAALLCFLAVGLAAFDPSRVSTALPLGLAGVGQGVYLSLFPLQGFEVAPVPAGETRGATKTVPLGTLSALLFSSVLFVLVQLVLVGSYPLLAQRSDRPLVEAAGSLSPSLGAVVAVGSVVSILGFTAGSAFGSPRYAQAIASRGALPEALGRTHPRWGSPHVAIAVSTLGTAALALSFDYRSLVGMSNFTVVVQYVASCLALVVLHRREALGGRAAAPWRRAIPLVGALGSLSLLAGSSLGELGFASAVLVVALVLRAALPRPAPAAG